MFELKFTVIDDKAVIDASPSTDVAKVQFVLLPLSAESIAKKVAAGEAKLSMMSRYSTLIIVVAL